jgi:catechol 2,3-dioxygenase-like lactoylglutathione lyase family enzyme
MKILTAVLLSILTLVPQESRRPHILGVAHISLFVSDIEKSRGFYKDFLGYEEPFKLSKPDGSLALTFIKINEDQYLELVPGLQPGADRLNHISLYTDDAEGLRAYLGSKDIKVPERVSKGRTGNTSFNVKDPEGHTVEFVQYEPDSWSSREKGKYLGEARISQRMRHLGILVSNLEAEAAFYEKLLGFKETWRGSSTGKVLSWVNVQVPDGPDYIEFMLAKELPAPDKRGTPHHICLETPDLGKALAALESRPYRQTYGRQVEARVGINRRRLSNLYDPDGTRVELMEPGTVDGTPTPSSTAPPPQ